MQAKAYPKGSVAYPRPPQRKRGPFILTIIGAAIILTIVLSTGSASTIPKEAARVIAFTKPFRPAAHEPPVQKNSTSGDAKWFSDWKWLHPFSSSITLDENRSVLPPLQERPPIYTFYDVDAEKTDEVRAAETKLLTIWRRAWWAQGFKPVILGRAEAMANPHYEEFQKHKLTTALEGELLRWLAWGHMGSGILANWLLLPMGSYDDHLLSFLRRGQYPRLTRYEGLGVGLYSGDRTAIDGAIAIILTSKKLLTASSIVEATSDPDMFAVDPNPSDIAFYNSHALTELYKPIADATLANQAQGLSYLATLITAHLHATFLNNFPSGLAVLVPFAPRCASFFNPALAIANSLNACADSPVPHSCPPNIPQCTPCSPLKILYPGSLSNDSFTFNIGIVPHPYTLNLLLAKQTEITVRHVRRDTPRDRWLTSITTDILGVKLAGSGRLVSFKDIVAGEYNAHRGLWLTAEKDIKWRDLEWHFGFELHRPNASSEDVAASADPKFMQPLLDTIGTKQPRGEELVLQQTILTEARAILSKAKSGKAFAQPEKMKDVCEAWNLADMEAWRFVRAYEARSRVERMKWEEEERGFVGGKE
jgi:hypothetical protein